MWRMSTCLSGLLCCLAGPASAQKCVHQRRYCPGHRGGCGGGECARWSDLALSLPYVAGSNGNYEAVASGMTVSAFDRYTARITIDTGGGVIKAIEHPLMALMAHE